MNIRPPRSMRRERGASLLVALIFLVIMAMLGVTVANVTTMQEKMAGHTRDRDLALQAAEAALRDAEQKLKDAGIRAAAPDIVGANANNDAFWETCFKDHPGPCAVRYTPTNTLPTSGEGAVAAQPEYVIEQRPAAGTEIYRVTARAVGGTVDAVVILQAEFGVTP